MTNINFQFHIDDSGTLFLVQDKVVKVYLFVKKLKNDHHAVSMLD